ncbi:DUF5330 domain-containing protein [Chelativorans sp.]|uniref:DUF5330 domain-containing protein n=1 Tax=Chelativorans sp. TaxID=2203393 RepID=UPI002810EC6D|nr:DUF5330 domain-containing protein [Chelativorans sp.]
MGLLVRSAAGLSLLFLILPIDVGETAGEQQQQVGPIQALFAARDAVLDLAGICERQPDVCATARAALATIVARATEAVRLAQSVGDSGQPPEAAVLPDAALPETAPAIPIPAQREASPAG